MTEGKGSGDDVSKALYDLITDQGEGQLPRDLLFTRPIERRAQ